VFCLLDTQTHIHKLLNTQTNTMSTTQEQLKSLQEQVDKLKQENECLKETVVKDIRSTNLPRNVVRIACIHTESEVDTYESPKYVIEGIDEKFQGWVHNHMYSDKLLPLTKCLLRKDVDGIYELSYTPVPVDVGRDVWEHFYDSYDDFPDTIDWSLPNAELRKVLFTDHDQLLINFFMKHMIFMITTHAKVLECDKPIESATEDDAGIKSALTIISDEEYEQFMKQLMHLPDRKKKRWKDHIWDKHGRKSLVKWRYNKLMEDHPDNGWTEIQSYSKAIGEGEDFKPVSRNGQLAFIRQELLKEGLYSPHLVNKYIECMRSKA